MIKTAKGEFDNLAHLRYVYLTVHDGNPPIQQYFRQDSWDAKTLHISELGKCPRKQMYRLMKAEPKVRKLSAIANDALMFWQGNIIHALTVGACYWAGIAISHEEPLPIRQTGWSGHYDLLYKPLPDLTVCWDGKTVRPNAFQYWYDWPKIEEKRQMQGYLRFLKEAELGEVEHIDRGGSNPPQSSIVERSDAWVDERMAYLDQCRAQLPELPEFLPLEYSLTYLKVRNEPIHKYNSIYYGPNWQCGWCDYLHGFMDKRTKEWTTFDSSPCKPDMRAKELVAKVEKGTLEFKSRKHQPHVKAWLESQLKEWYDPDEDVESED